MKPDADTRPGPWAQRLRPYQIEAGRAILDSVLRRRGLSFSVEIARQGGKNELSVQLEALLLTLHLSQDVDSVKCAPTFDPQARISLRRLWSRLVEAGLSSIAAVEAGHIVRVGRARTLFMSAGPDANVVGHSAQLLLEVDEAQDVDEEKFDREFRPMAATTNATIGFYGTAWSETTLLERAKQRHLELERRDGILLMTFHTDGGPLQWGSGPHTEFSQVFSDVGGDPGTGGSRCSSSGRTIAAASWRLKPRPLLVLPPRPPGPRPDCRRLMRTSSAPFSVLRRGAATRQRRGRGWGSAHSLLWRGAHRCAP